MARRDQTFPDPQQFKKEEEFNYAAKVVSVYKKVISEILAEIENYVKEADSLFKKSEGKTIDPFQIGGENDGS